MSQQIPTSALPSTPDVTNSAWIPLGSVDRPDSTVDPSKKGEGYCNLVARFHASRVSGSHINWFRTQYATNAAFARGEWGTEEDRQLFLKDGERDTTRKELSIPLAHPMVMRYVGQAASLSISAEATAVTQYATTRREMQKSRALAMTIHAQQGPFVAQAVATTAGFGDDPDQAIADAVGNYVDPYVRAINNLLTMQERTNEYEYMKDSYANIMACSGLFAAQCYRQGMRLRWRMCHPMEVAWDTAANRPDMQDSEFIIACPLMNTSELAERYKAKKELVKQLDTLASQYNSSSASSAWPQGKPRVMTVYWYEPVWVKQGYVIIDGVPCLCVLDEADPITGKVYTKDDCITPPKNEYTKDWNDNYHAGFIEQVWYCTFIPWEYTPAASLQGIGSKYEKGKSMDVVLACGPYELQERIHETPYRAGFPIKLSAVEYIDGYVIAPLTATISPQRVINQVTSQLVWQMSKSGNKSTWVNPLALADSNSDVSQVSYDLKEGNTVEINPTAVGGIANAAGVIDTSLGESHFRLWGILPQIQGIGQQATGLYDSTQGKASGAGQLVGTTELLLQQSGAMMQSWNRAIEHGFRQVHQHDAQAGKLFYQQFPWALAEMVGDLGLETLMQSKHMTLEQFRVIVKTSVNSTQLKAATDQMILEFMKLGLLDKVTAAKLGDRSYPSDVWNASRSFTEQEVRAAQAQMEQQAKQQQAAAIADQATALQERYDKAYDQGMKLMAEKMKVDQKTFQPVAQREAEAAIPLPSDKPAAPASTPGT